MLLLFESSLFFVIVIIIVIIIVIVIAIIIAVPIIVTMTVVSISIINTDTYFPLLGKISRELSTKIRT